MLGYLWDHPSLWSWKTTCQRPAQTDVPFMSMILEPLLLFCHDLLAHLNGGGDCMSKESYFSMLGSKISKPEGWGGWMQQEVFLGDGGWLLSRGLHRGALKRSPNRSIRRGSALSPPIGCGGRADVGATAGGEDDSCSLLSHHRMVMVLQRFSLSLTHPSCAGGLLGSQRTTLAWVTLKDRSEYTTCFSSHQRWT